MVRTRRQATSIKGNVQGQLALLERIERKKKRVVGKIEVA